MRWIQTAVLAAVITAASSGNALAGFMTGNEVLEDCRNKEDSYFNSGYCTGYISGVYDVLSAGDSVIGWRSCPPLGVTVGQVTDVVKAWLEARPEKRHLAASSLVANALAEAFPCTD